MYFDLVESVPASGRGLGTIWSLKSLPAQTLLQFYEICFLFRIHLKKKQWCPLGMQKEKLHLQLKNLSTQELLPTSDPSASEGKQEKLQ